MGVMLLAKFAEDVQRTMSGRRTAHPGLRQGQRGGFFHTLVLGVYS